MPRRPHAGELRRERRALTRARRVALEDAGGLLVEMYRRGSFRDDLLAERAASVVGIDARLHEIDEFLHAGGGGPRCACGTPILRGAHFCPTCGRDLQARAAAAPSRSSEETMIEPGPGA